MLAIFHTFGMFELIKLDTEKCHTGSGILPGAGESAPGFLYRGGTDLLGTFVHVVQFDFGCVLNNAKVVLLHDD